MYTKEHQPEMVPRLALWASPCIPPPWNYPSGTSLSENLTSTSKSGSEVTILTRDDRGEYFWLNGTSLQGQRAELETSAGWPARFSSASLWHIRKTRLGRYNQDKSMAGRYGTSKEDHCTSSSLSNNTRKWPHLQTHREETLQRDQRKNRLLRRLAG